MIVKTKAIVLRVVKFKDTSLIVKCYTELGIKSYLVKGILSHRKSKLKAAYFQLLNILDLIAYHNKKGNLNSIKEAKINYPLNNIYTNMVKQSIVMFLAEILNYALQEEEANKTLFQFIKKSLKFLDKEKKIGNFHLLFLLKLTGFLGFYPQIKNLDYPYFNLQEGLFENKDSLTSIKDYKINLFKSLLGTNFDSMQTLILNKKEKNMLLDILVNYYELHLTGFKKLNSLPILKTLFI